MGLNVPFPKDLSLWRINFSRVEWQHEIKNGKYVRKNKPDGTGVLPEYNWVWSPQDAINMHIPDRWGYLIFLTKRLQKVLFNTNCQVSKRQRDGFGLDMTLNKLFMEKIKHIPLTQVS
jgi:hypothetical protein